jgi:hypothetical protein
VKGQQIIKILGTWLFLLFLAGCSLLGNERPLTPEIVQIATATPIDVFDISAFTQSSTLIPLPTRTLSNPTPMPPASLNGFYFDSLDMVDDQIGWAVLRKENANGYPVYRIGRTENGGRSWQDITPSELSFSDNEYQKHKLRVSALNRNTAWAYLFCWDSGCWVCFAMRSVDGGG